MIQFLFLSGSREACKTQETDEVQVGQSSKPHGVPLHKPQAIAEGDKALMWSCQEVPQGAAGMQFCELSPTL